MLLKNLFEEPSTIEIDENSTCQVEDNVAIVEDENQKHRIAGPAIVQRSSGGEAEAVYTASPNLEGPRAVSGKGVIVNGWDVEQESTDKDLKLMIVDRMARSDYQQVFEKPSAAAETFGVAVEDFNRATRL